jgi:hypothetical protein
MLRASSYMHTIPARHNPFRPSYVLRSYEYIHTIPARHNPSNIIWAHIPAFYTHLCNLENTNGSFSYKGNEQRQTSVIVLFCAVVTTRSGII